MTARDRDELEAGKHQADPMLRTRRNRGNPNRSSPAQVGLATAAIVMVIALLFYGLNHQRDESKIDASTSAPQTTASTPAPEPSRSQQNPGAPPQPGQQQQQAAPQTNPPTTSGQASDSR
jgi:hypothetical protein